MSVFDWKELAKWVPAVQDAATCFQYTAAVTALVGKCFARTA